MRVFGGFFTLSNSLNYFFFFPSHKESEKISMTLPSPVVANNSHTELEVQLSELRKEVDEYKDIIELQDQVLRVRQC